MIRTCHKRGSSNTSISPLAFLWFVLASRITACIFQHHFRLHPTISNRQKKLRQPYKKMPSQPAIPPLLAPYLSSLPQSSLTLVSSILGATSNWLVLRFLYAALSTSSNQNAASELEGVQNGAKRKVVFVSFMRSFEFWKSEAKRLVCI